MRRTTGTGFVVIVAVATVLSAGEPTQGKIGEFGWLAGHWRSATGRTVIEEGWLGPAGGTMLGVNRTVSGDRTLAFEYLRLEERDGGLVLLASPGGRHPATTFTLVKLEEQGAVFANPDHDFPQQISYRREGDRLMAEISGADEGEKKSIGWVFERVP